MRDEDRTKSFTVGEPILLTINGQNVWRGFVATVNRVYVFPALNVDDFGLARFIDITGTDINILLTKRIVFDQATPTRILAPLLSAHTPDVTAIDELLDDWLDLSGDGLNTTDFVENVGDTTWTQSGRAWEGSDTWSQAMQSIANIPAAIWYIDPDRNFVYTDVDTPNAPFALSDQPNGVTVRGYREMEVLQDGSGLANDVLAWGLGYGSQTPVFVRDEDATSQAAHGLWQLAQITFGVYKQATIDRIATSIIDGSPQSKRGAKDDKVSVQCVTYEPGLRVAQKVDFSSETFGFNDVLPVRKMEVDFPGPDTPKYTLTLSHEIDTPFNFFDNFMWNFQFPPFPGLPPFGFPMPGADGECACGITDTFTRTETGQWGISDALIPWVTDITGAGQITVEGTYARFFSTTSGDFNSAFLPYIRGTSFSVRFQINLKTLPGASSWFTSGTIGGSSYSIENFGTFRLRLVASGASTATLNAPPISADAWYEVRWQQDSGTAQQIKFWPVGDPEPGDWTLEQSTAGQTAVAADGISFDQSNDTSSDFEIWYDSLDVQSAVGLGSSAGTAIFDNFNRVDGAGWGSPSSGDGAWDAFFAPTGGDNFNQSTSVNGSAGVATSEYHGVQASPGGRTIGAGFLTELEDYEMEVTFSFETAPPDAPVDEQCWAEGLYIGLGSGGGGSGGVSRLQIAYRWNGDGLPSSDPNTGRFGIGGADMAGVFTTDVPALTAATVYHIRFAVLRSIATVRASLYTGSFPGWMLEADITAPAPSWPSLAVGLDAVAGGPAALQEQATVYIDEITRSFPANNGSTSAAVNRCNDFYWDTFDREVVGGWGTATPSGSVWTNGSGSATPSVSNTRGIISATNNQTRTMSAAGGIEPWLGGAFTQFVAFRVNAVPTTTGSLILTVGDSGGGVVASCTVKNGTGGQIAAGTSTFAKTDWVANTDYILEVAYDGATTVQARVSAATAALPDYMVTNASASTPSGSLNVTFNNSGTGATRTTSISYINYDYSDKPCYEGGTIATDIPSLNTYACENQISHGSDTIVTLAPFLANSTEVWVNGALYAQSTYIEDPLGASIELGFTPDAGSTIRVCYQSLP